MMNKQQQQRCLNILSQLASAATQHFCPSCSCTSHQSSSSTAARISPNPHPDPIRPSLSSSGSPACLFPSTTTILQNQAVQEGSIITVGKYNRASNSSLTKFASLLLEKRGSDSANPSVDACHWLPKESTHGVPILHQKHAPSIVRSLWSYCILHPETPFASYGLLNYQQVANMSTQCKINVVPPDEADSDNITTFRLCGTSIPVKEVVENEDHTTTVVIGYDPISSSSSTSGRQQQIQQAAKPGPAEDAVREYEFKADAYVSASVVLTHKTSGSATQDEYADSTQVVYCELVSFYLEKKNVYPSCDF